MVQCHVTNENARNVRRKEAEIYRANGSNLKGFPGPVARKRTNVGPQW